jgi:hypothetical protein
MQAIIQKIQNDFYQVKFDTYHLAESGLMLVLAIGLVVFFISLSFSGKPSWMALVAVIAAFVISAELQKCRPVPPPGPTSRPPASSPTIPHLKAPPQPTPTATPTATPIPLPSASPQSSPIPSPSPTPNRSPVLPPIPAHPSPSPTPTLTPIPPVSPSPSPLTLPTANTIPIAIISDTTEYRFEAVLIQKQGRTCKLRLFDTKTDDWLDDENHIFQKEPQLGAILVIDGVTAEYVGTKKDRK